jgi:hypothetical protein
MDLAMSAITRTRPGHWADQNARFMDLVEGDQRVSLAEQQDYLPSRQKKSWQDSIWLVVLLCLSALCAPFIGSLIAIWK